MYSPLFQNIKNQPLRAIAQRGLFNDGRNHYIVRVIFKNVKKFWRSVKYSYHLTQKTTLLVVATPGEPIKEHP